jgi:antagonist of KipI
MAVTGAGYEVMNYIWTFPLWVSFYVRAGWVVQVKKGSDGNWAYLAVAGGFDTQKILASGSTYLRGNIGESISTGTRLQTGRSAHELVKLAARDFPLQKRPSYSSNPTIEVIRGPQEFSEEAMHTFLGNEYTLSASVDRMGYRLEGAAIQYDASELISEGMTMGSVQIPPSGQPIVMMADGPTTGGYPKIATVTKASLPILAQCEARKSKIRFIEVSVDEAQHKYRTLMKP